MWHILSYHALHANKLSGTEAILASGARLVQHPSVKNLWGNAGPPSPFPCIFCWEMNVLYSVTFSTILSHFQDLAEGGASPVGKLGGGLPLDFYFGLG